MSASGPTRPPRFSTAMSDYWDEAVAAYWAIVAAKPKEKITLRQGARVVMRNWAE